MMRRDRDLADRSWPDDGAPAQLPLPFAAPRHPTGARIAENLFFAILPDAAAKAEIAELARRLCRELPLAGRPVAPDCLHVSLQSLGAYTQARPDIVAVGKRIGAAIAAVPFRATFDRAMSFNAQGGRALVLGCGSGGDALDALRRAILGQMALTRLGQPLRRPYVPHLTLLYARHEIVPIALPPIAWTARELVLVRSLYGQGRHVQLGRWPLRG